MDELPTVSQPSEESIWDRSLIPVVCCIALLLVAAFTKMPYSFYVFLRLFTTGVAIYVAMQAYAARRTLWVWIFAGVAITFNPIFPVRMQRDDWVLFNFGAAILLGAWLVANCGILSRKS